MHKGNPYGVKYGLVIFLQTGNPYGVKYGLVIFLQTGSPYGALLIGVCFRCFRVSWFGVVKQKIYKSRVCFLFIKKALQWYFSN